MRSALIIAHRWAGLVIALFLGIAGITGATLPFREELSWLCAPKLWSAQRPSAETPLLSGPQLAERVQAQTGGQPVQIPLSFDGSHAVSMFIFAPAGHQVLGFDQVIVDPYTAAIKARLNFGVVESFPRDLPNFLLSLHYGRILGPWGLKVFGIAALIWLIDAFVSIILTFPRRHGTIRFNVIRDRHWFKAWGPHWKVRSLRPGFRRTFDLHRASGLWLWPLAIVFAWSAFGMNVPEWQGPIVRALGARSDSAPAPLPEPEQKPKLTYSQAAERGAELMSAAALKQGFTVRQRQRLNYMAALGAYRYDVASSLEVGEGGATSVWLSSADGHQLALDLPSPRTIDRIDTWADALHETTVFGLPYRVFVSISGLLVTTIVVTGVIIYARKQTGRAKRSTHAAEIASL